MNDHNHVVDHVDLLIADVRTKIRRRIEGDPFVQVQAVYEDVIKEKREQIGQLCFIPKRKGLVNII